MADENRPVDKEAEKARKQAEKEALKAKKERIKQSKPKKEGNVFARIWAAIVKFFKDFRGTCKKVIWPDRKTVFKSTLVVLATVLVVGAAIWIVDFGLTKGIRGLQDVIANAGQEEESSEEVALPGEEEDEDSLTDLIEEAVSEPAAEIAEAVSEAAGDAAGLVEGESADEAA